MPFDDRTASVLEEAEHLKLTAQHEASIRLLERLLADDPGNVAALEEIADNELSLGRYDRAKNAAKQAVALDDESYMGHYVLGFIMCGEKRWKVAVKELKAANNIRQNNTEILRCLGLALFNGGEKVRGIVTLERAVNLDPGNILAICDLGDCYFAARNFKKAYSLFGRALELDPENGRVHACMGRVEKMMRRRRRA